MLTHANKAIAQYLHAVTSGMISHTQDVLLRSAMTKNYSSAEVAALYASLMNSPLRPSYTNWSTKLHTADLTSEFAASFISTLTHALALLPLGPGHWTLAVGIGPWPWGLDIGRWP